MAEPGGIERITGKFALALATFVQILEADWITEAHEIFTPTSPPYSIRPGRHSSATCLAHAPERE